MAGLKVSGQLIDSLSKKLDELLGTSFIGRLVKPVLLQFLNFLMTEVIKLIEEELNEIRNSVDVIKGGGDSTNVKS